MNKTDLKTLNADLVQLITSVRDQIDEILEELAAIDDPDAEEILALSDEDQTGCD